MFDILNIYYPSILPLGDGSFFLEIQDIQEEIQLNN